MVAVQVVGGREISAARRLWRAPRSAASLDTKATTRVLMSRKDGLYERYVAQSRGRIMYASVADAKSDGDCTLHGELHRCCNVK